MRGTSVGRRGVERDCTATHNAQQGAEDAFEPPARAIRTQRYACCLCMRRTTHPRAGARTMLWTLAVVLFILWILGFGVFHVAGGLIHLLLVIAIVVVLVRLITGRRVV